MLDRHRDQQTGHRFHSLLVSYRPGSSLLAAAGPAGSTSAAVAVRTVQEARTGPGVARSRGLAGRDWASRSSRCCWAGLAGMAACRPGCMGRHLGGPEAATGGIAAVRPVVEVSETVVEGLAPMREAETCGAGSVEELLAALTAALEGRGLEPTYCLFASISEVCWKGLRVSCKSVGAHSQVDGFVLAAVGVARRSWAVLGSEVDQVFFALLRHDGCLSSVVLL